MFKTCSSIVSECCRVESRRIRTHVCPSASTGAARENTNVSVVETMPKEAGEAGVLLRKVSDSKMV